MTTIIGEKKNYFKGPFTAYLAVGGPMAGLVAGVDYTRSGIIDEANFPAKTAFEHAFPSKAANGVYGFDHIAYGNLRNTVPPTPIPAKKISDIAVLQHTIDFSLSGYVTGYNVIVDTFLTAVAGSFTTMTEVMVFLHASTSGAAWLKTGKIVAGYVDASGRLWDVVSTPGIYSFVPADGLDAVKGVIDLKEMYQFLAFKKFVDAAYFYNGHGVGVEIVQFGGRVDMTGFAVAYS